MLEQIKWNSWMVWEASIQLYGKHQLPVSWGLSRSAWGEAVRWEEAAVAEPRQGYRWALLQEECGLVHCFCGSTLVQEHQNRHGTQTKADGQEIFYSAWNGLGASRTSVAGFPQKGIPTWQAQNHFCQCGVQLNDLRGPFQAKPFYDAVACRRAGAAGRASC